MSRRLWQNKAALMGLVLITFFIFIGVIAPYITPHDPLILFPDSLRLPPLSSNIHGDYFFLGTDDVGRDLFSRLILGARLSLLVGLSVVALALVGGTTLGMLAGYFGGMTDRLIMRFIDILMSMPSILLAIVIVAILGPGLWNAILAVSVVAIPQFTRVVRASVMQECTKDYVAAARAQGSPPFRILLREIMPNCSGPLVVQASLGVSDGILNVAGLGFLGLGAQAPLPEWGMMLSDARTYIESTPWLVTLPGLCLLITVISFNLLGDGLRDALDPKAFKKAL